MPQFVLKHGGIKTIDIKPGKDHLRPSDKPDEPLVLELDQDEADKLNGPKAQWGSKGACLVPLAEHQAELAAGKAATQARAKVLAEAAKPAAPLEPKPLKGGK